ncbi:hypothetical protein AWE51_16820 [Aquimarina aggregata]|uniref:Septum formation inhibitor Maf n=1 Tax=Aquimarina aggregata TaxID=1642818 RepID=A0A163D598_9FLAO|nr:hypothetical protein [Aquimarina aggregata]KZS43006.1 hypothetical protein AWE51_16820 [Aquimarina aggregata]
MKKSNIYISLFSLSGILILTIIISSFTKSKKDEKLPLNTSISNLIFEGQRTVSKKTKEFWFDGKAELSSYKLTQARYGETHQGTAVLVYVTEPFSKKANTKADHNNPNNVSVLKLNKTLKFNTGIYPYSMMTSTFFPLEKENTSLKITSSLQEWCGMTHLEMKNETDFIFDFSSYYEGFTFKNKVIKKTILEDDLWTLMRLNPELLPIGEYDIIPSMSFLRLRNREPKAYKAIITLQNDDKGTSHYTMNYPELERELTIHYTSIFPYAILGWEDTHYSGYGDEKKLQTSKAELLKTIKTDYWNQNHNKDKHWRKKLEL